MADVDIAMKIDGITGDVGAKGFDSPAQIQLLTAEYNTMRTGAKPVGTKTGAEKSTMKVSSVNITKPHDSASSGLGQFAGSEQTKDVTISFLRTSKTGPQAWKVVELTNAWVQHRHTQHRTGGNDVEEYTLSFDKMKETHKSYSDKGTVSDSSTNTYDLVGATVS